MEIAAQVDLLSLIPQHNFVELARDTLLKRYYFQCVIFFLRLFFRISKLLFEKDNDAIHVSK